MVSESKISGRFFLTVLSDIRFWLLFFFLIRLYGITLPPLEGIHNWRQSTVCMVARNFSETDSNILFPRIDIAGGQSGITSMEFPLMNYLMFLANDTFGMSHWYGRIINLIISTLGIWYFYKLIKKYFDHSTALYAAILLSSSLWFLFSRKSMPDTFAVSLLLAAFWHMSEFMEGPRNHRIADFLNLFLFVVFGTAGLLSKLPAGMVLLPSLLLFFRKEITVRRKLIILAAGALCLIPVYWWYYVWCPYLLKTFGFQHFFAGTTLKQGWLDIRENPGRLAQMFYDLALRYTGFIAMIAALVMMLVKRNKKLIWIVALSLAGLFILMLKGGNTFLRHSYYLIPVLPCLALLAVYSIKMIPWKWLSLLILLVICTENITSNLDDFHLKPKEAALVNLEKDMDRFSARNDLIIINSGEVPTPMYMAHRKGWVTTNENLQNSDYLLQKKNLGAKIVLVLKRNFGSDVKLPLPVQCDTEDWTIYRL
jgi:4-amino-4-deoxy-L-arabinose transferase-like glycosyltransferase